MAKVIKNLNLNLKYNMDTNQLEVAQITYEVGLSDDPAMRALKQIEMNLSQDLLADVNGLLAEAMTQCEAEEGI